VLGYAALNLGSLVLKPYLHPPGRHTQLVSKLDSGLLVGHLICLENLLQYCELIRTSSLPLFLVKEIAVVFFCARQFDPVKLEQDHSKKHDLPFIVLVIVQVKLNE